MVLLQAQIFIGDCWECDKPIRGESGYIMFGARKICEDCKSLYAQCAYCSSWENDESVTVVNDEAYCDSCFEDQCFSCGHCNGNYLNETYNITSNNEPICPDCHEYYSSCYHCEDYYLFEDTQYCDTCEYTFCQYCFDENHDCEKQEIGSIKHCDNPGNKIKIKRLVGLEIEAENGNRSQLKLDDCGIDDDGSLNDGTEVKTPPRELADLELMIHNTTKSMRNANFEIETTCGLHVHLDASDFKDNYHKIASLFRTFFAIEDLIYASLPEARRTNTFCKPLARDYRFGDISHKIKPAMIDKTWYQGDINKREHHHGSRYHGLNLHSIFYRGTVEFRYHSGSLNERKILNWVNFLLHATEYASKRYKYREVLALLKMKNHKRKFEYMVKIFKIDRKTAEYMKYRINLNSPTFFNQLKEREIE